MQYEVGGIIKDVRVALDENDVLTALIASDSNSLTLDEIIAQKLLHAIRDISLTAPAVMLSDAPPMATGAITWGERTCGSITLPNDFLRLVAFRMSDWQRVVTSPIYESDADYSMQRSKYTGVHGNTIKPVVAIVEAGNWRKLEFYSCDSDTATVAVAKYIPTPVVINSHIAICREIYNAVIYYTAGLSAAAVGSAAAESLFKIANDQLSV
jgi:hypothetical protein